jgi:hypothetical protein
MGLGILLSAMSGAGNALADSATQAQKINDEQTLMKQRADMEEQKAKSVALFNNQLAVDTSNNQRSAMTGRIDDAKHGILQGIIAKKANAATDYTNDDGSVSPASFDELPDEDAANPAYQPTDQESRDATTQAAIQTGDIGPKDVMQNTSKMELNQLRMDNQMGLNQAKMDGLLARANDRNSTNTEIANIRAEAITSAAQLRIDAANQRATNGKIDTATGRMLITSEDANIKASTSQLNMLNQQLPLTSPTKNNKPNPVYDEIKSQMDGLRSDIKSSQTTKAGYLKDMGLMKDPSTGGNPAFITPSNGLSDPNSDGGQISILQNELNTETDPANKSALQREIDRAKAAAPTPKSSKAPYPDGTALTGPGGKSYIVKNGVPVPQ